MFGASYTPNKTSSESQDAGDLLSDFKTFISAAITLVTIVAILILNTGGNK